MAATVTWSPRALDELYAIADFLAQTAPGYGKAFAASVFQAVRRLEVFPRSGRVVPEIGDEAVRELLHRGYRIVYVVTGDEVKVLSVFHSAKPFGP